MASLFVAVDLPGAVTEELAALRLPASESVRWTEPDQMHLTLHYIGVAESDRIASALSALTGPIFSLSIEGVGQFESADGVVTLWGGVRECEDLRRLHARVATALSTEGFQPEARPYTPHITLARCERGRPNRLVESFLSQHGGFSLPAISITEFSLYASRLNDGVPTYTRERAFPLLGSGPRRSHLSN